MPEHLRSQVSRSTADRATIAPPGGHDQPDRPADQPAAVTEEQTSSIGSEIRRLRQARGIGLRDLASRAGLSPGFLSLVERDRSSIGMASLGAIASALGTHITRLIPIPGAVDQEYRQPQVTRADGEPRASIRTANFEYRLLSSAWPGRTLESMLWTVPPRSRDAEPYGHQGEEFVYVLEGELVYDVDGVESVLRPGDSIHLQSGVPHATRNDRDDPVLALIVSTARIL